MSGGDSNQSEQEHCDVVHWPKQNGFIGWCLWMKSLFLSVHQFILLIFELSSSCTEATGRTWFIRLCGFCSTCSRTVWRIGREPAAHHGVFSGSCVSYSWASHMLSVKLNVAAQMSAFKMWLEIRIRCFVLFDEKGQFKENLPYFWAD